MRTIDSIIFFAYLAGILSLGLAVSRRKQTNEDFLLAGRSMRWLVVGSSVLATAFSAINFTAFTEEVFSHGLYVVMSLTAFVLVAFPIIKIIMPFYHEMRPVSAYEYLEKRFDKKTRRLASIIFIFWRISWMTLALYATARFLSSITGINLYYLVLMASVITTAYTLTGGMRTVMWMNLVQFLMLFTSLIVGVIVAAGSLNGFSGIFSTAGSGGLIKPFLPLDPQIFSLDPTIRISMWSAVIGTCVAFLSRYGVDQMVVQRYFTAKTLDDAKKGFVLNAVVSIISRLCLAFLGLAIFAYIAAHPDLNVPGTKPMVLIGKFIKSLPYGACGLLVAGLMASTMSNIDAGMHSCSTAFTSDFSQSGNPAGQVRTMRILTLLISIVITVCACFVGNLGSIFEIANKIINAIGSPLLALFIVGKYMPSCNSAGAFVGGIAGMLLSICTSLWMNHLALHYYAVVNLLGTILACMVFSMILPSDRTASNHRTQNE